LAKEDAEKMTIPHICLASPGESAEVVKQYADILGGEGKIGEVETYSSMFHGWMGAKSNLQNVENAKEFERGYAALLAPDRSLIWCTLATNRWFNSLPNISELATLLFATIRCSYT
jgi:hypothetical protein